MAENQDVGEDGAKHRWVPKKAPATVEEQKKEFSTWSEDDLDYIIFILKHFSGDSYTETVEIAKQVLKEKKEQRALEKEKSKVKSDTQTQDSLEKR